jgi:hypothetical protein
VAGRTIRLRAIAQIARLSREIEKAEFVPKKGACPATGGQTKEQQIRDAGLEVRTVNRYEQLARLELNSAPRVECAARARLAACWQFLFKAPAILTLGNGEKGRGGQPRAKFRHLAS